MTTPGDVAFAPGTATSAIEPASSARRAGRSGAPRRRLTVMARALAFPVVALILGGMTLMTLSGSQSAFSSATDNDGNLITASALNPPTGLTASCGTSITLNWTATADTYASGHRVLRASTPGGPYSQIAEITPRTTTTYVDSPGAGVYYYVVRAYFQSWESVNSVSATALTPCSTFGAVADTYVKQDKGGDDNFGTAIEMQVKSLETKEKRAFARFDISSIPAGSTINSAMLTLCLNTVPAVTRTYDVHRVTASWVETTVVWNDQPGVAATPTDSATTPAVPGCMTWTVTGDVQVWVDGTTNDGWRVSDSVIDATNETGKFRSREDSTVPAEQPKLKVDYTPP